jgi:hypothetical protein
MANIIINELPELATAPSAAAFVPITEGGVTYKYSPQVIDGDSYTIQVRRDTAANWASVNPVLHQGEYGRETDTGKEKCGDGATAWNSLGYDGHNGWLYKDFTSTLPDAGSSNTFAHGITHAKIRNIDSIALIASPFLAILPFVIELDGTRTAHYNVYELNGTIYISSDNTLLAIYVGATVYIRVWYIP